MRLRQTLKLSWRDLVMIMSLKDLLAQTGASRHEEIEVTEEKLIEHIDDYRDLIAY